MAGLAPLDPPYDYNAEGPNAAGIWGVTSMDLGDRVPDLTFEVGPGRWQRLDDWGHGPKVLIFLRHLA